MKKTSVFGRCEFELPQDAFCVEIKMPCGSVALIPIFERQRAEFSYDHRGYETVLPVGELGLEARFTARAAGVHEMTAYDTRRNVLQNVAFEAEDTGLGGYVVVSEDDPRYFSLSCGSPYVPIGINMVETNYDPLPESMNHFTASKKTATVGMKQWRRWFAQLRAAGANYCRIWLSNTYTLALPCSSAEAFWIMDEAPGDVAITGGGVSLPTFVHGCVIRMVKAV